MSETFTYAGRASSEFGITAYDKETFTGPSRVYDPLTIPGKNGTVLIDSKRYNNVQMVYSCIIPEYAETRFDSFKQFLLSKVGYNRLTDSIHPGEFYEAAVMSDLTPTFDRARGACKFTVTFNRKPQRFLDTGTQSSTFSSSGSLYNPTSFPSRPLIRIYGTGYCTINGTRITIESNPYYIDVDCDIMECYYGTYVENDRVVLDKNDYPTLSPGYNTISVNTVSQVIITPRWYKL